MKALVVEYFSEKIPALRQCQVPANSSEASTAFLLTLPYPVCSALSTCCYTYFFLSHFLAVYLSLLMNVDNSDFATLELLEITARERP